MRKRGTTKTHFNPDIDNQDVVIEGQDGFTEEVDLDEVEVTSNAETKAEAFKRVANFRLEKTVMRLRQFHALANTGNYEYTDEQISYIISALDAEVTEVANAFKGGKEADIPQL